MTLDWNTYPYGWKPCGLGYCFLKGSEDILTEYRVDGIKLVLEQFGTVVIMPNYYDWFLDTAVGRLTFGVCEKKNKAVSTADAGPRIFVRGLNMNNKDSVEIRTILSEVKFYVNMFCPRM